VFLIWHCVFLNVLFHMGHAAWNKRDVCRPYMYVAYVCIGYKLYMYVCMYCNVCIATDYYEIPTHKLYTCTLQDWSHFSGISRWATQRQKWPCFVHYATLLQSDRTYPHGWQPAIAKVRYRKWPLLPCITYKLLYPSIRVRSQDSASCIG